MKGLIITSFVIASCLLAGTAFAQNNMHSYKDNNYHKNETIIMQNDNGSGKTVIEIKNGEVYVNGKQVTSVDDGGSNTYKKIIIEGNGMAGGNNNMPGDDVYNNKQYNAPHSAMLGVFASPDHDGDGAYVEQITRNSPAEKAGLQRGDIITKINDERIASSRQLVESIHSYKPGDEVKVVYQRDGETSATQVTLTEAPDKTAMNQPRSFNNMFEGMDMPNGMMPPFMNNSADFIIHDNLPKYGFTAEDKAEQKGAVITEIKPNSAAAEAGLQRNDIITHWNQHAITSVDDIQQALSDTEPGKPVTVKYKRNGAILIAKLTMKTKREF